VTEDASPTDRSFDDSVQHQLRQDGERSVILKRGSPHAIEWAAEQLAAGGVIGLPTDTVYGIAASLGHAGAIARIFEIKQRPRDRPLPVLVSSTRALMQIAHIPNGAIRDLLDEFWPGPLTIVVPGVDGLPRGVRGEDGTVAVRLPNHPLAIEIIEKSGGAVACSSANLSGDPPALTADETAENLRDKLDLVIDGGLAPGGVASTVVMAVDNDLRILREGGLATQELLDAWATIRSGMTA
jgi:L-threonylcarbamoyladenylate synthase